VEDVFGSLTYDILIANVTADSREFTLRVILRDSGEDVLSEQVMQVSTAPYSWRNSEVQGTIDTSSISEPGIYQILFQLEESGVQQDQKLVEFIVLVDDVPTNLPGDCLVGNWQVDNQSYLEFLQYVTEDASEEGEFVEVKGVSGFILEGNGQMNMKLLMT